jgi:hypothetical protein
VLGESQPLVQALRILAGAQEIRFEGARARRAGRQAHPVGRADDGKHQHDPEQELEDAPAAGAAPAPEAGARHLARLRR